jgi:hypothetical protein
MRINRRQLLSLTVAVGVAGCSGSDGSDGGTDQPNTETATEPPTETPTPDPAKFEVVGYEAPDRVEIGEAFVMRATIENTGGQSGSFTAPIYFRTSKSGISAPWEEGGERNLGTISPGESVTVEFFEGSLTFIARYEFRIGENSPTTVIQTVPASLSWGTEYHTLDGYEIRVDEPTLQDTYEYDNYGGIEERAPEDGGQWAFVNVYVKNPTAVNNFPPLPGDFSIVTGNTQYDRLLLDGPDPINKNQQLQFEGEELQQGIERSGVIVYAIDSGLSIGDLRVALSKNTLHGEIAVNWQTE